MHTRTAKALFTFGAKYRNKSLWPEYEKLKESEWLTRSQLVDIQSHNAHRFLQFAKKHSPYYKKILGNLQFNPDNFTGTDSLKEIPTVTKTQLIEHNKAIHSNYHFKKCFTAETSGTSGNALEFSKNEVWDSINRANMMRAYDWYGVKPWNRYGYFWGYNIAPSQAYKTRLLDYLQNRFRLFKYDRASIEMFAEKLSTATFVAGYSSMVYEVAIMINELDIPKPNLKMVKGTSEMILDAYQPAAIEAFGSKIVSEYGAAESGLIAFECPEGSMHINIENVIVETDADDEIIITNLASYSFPVIRYRLGDAVKLSDSDCACGRKHPVIKEVIGRKGSVVIGNNGSYPALTFYYVFKNLAIHNSILLNYKAVQNNKGHVDIFIEGTQNSSYETEIYHELEKYFSDDVIFSVIFTSSFDKTLKKRQYFESKL